jgi:hypothetical protein
MSDTNSTPETRRLERREAQIEAELESRLSASERQARTLRAATLKPEPDTRPLSELSTDERQARNLSDSHNA